MSINKKAILLLPLLILTSSAFAAKGLSEILAGLNENLKALATLLQVVAYISGVGFFLAGVLQFKAHRDNPAQVPLSKPMVYLGVASGLLFLPTILEVAGETVFGGEQASAKDSEL